MAVTLTDAAARHVTRYIAKRGKGLGVRLGVKRPARIASSVRPTRSASQTASGSAWACAKARTRATKGATA